MKKLLIILLIPFAATAQKEISLEVQFLQNQNVFKSEKVFEVAHVYDRATKERGVRQFTNFKATKPKNKYVRLKVPIGGIEIPVLVYKVEMNTNVLVSFGSTQKTNNVTHYRGVVENTDDIVALSFFEGGEVFGNLQIEKESYTIAKIGDAQVIYNDKDVQQQVWTCGTVIKQSDLPTTSEMRSSMSNMDITTDKCVQWYYEIDYDIYLNKGAGTAAYIQAVFNQVQTLHENNGIHINLKTLFVWTTPDPYTGTTAHDYLDQFGAYRTSFDGNLGMLLGYYGGGGVAYVNTLCSVSTRARQGYSAISMSYSAVPTYSWTVEVISHEGGHLLGSPHTHDCAWNGNNTRIDSCGDSRGYSSCSQLPQPIRLPQGGGTIMSYCHLTSVGINFNKGFGEQPRERILSKIAAATCLGTICNNEPCPVPAQPTAIQGSTNVAWKSQQVYTVQQVYTATSYTWTIPTSGWTGSSTTNSLTATAGSIGGTITVRANNNCGVSPTTSIAVTVIQCVIPAQPSIIKADNYACMWSGDVNVFMVDNVAGVTYNWTVPTGCEVMSGQGTNVLMVKFDTTFKTSSISVTATNSCGTSAARSIQVVKCGSLCAVPKIIKCSITQRVNDVIVIRSGYTNYNYKWWKNSKLQGTYQTKIINSKPVEIFVPLAGWGYQTVSNKLFTKDDVLEVEVGSTNGQTVRECYITGHCEITIK